MLGLCRHATAEELLPSVQHGLPSDSRADWRHHYTQLQSYVSQHGDAHCGFRQEDDVELARWCKKQRTAHRQDKLSQAQTQQLSKLGFAFDGEVAEWWCWYDELCKFAQRHGSTESGPFTSQHDIYLTNWCRVQRIARRSGVLSGYRIKLLDDLQFSWSGADPLS